jgi:hypothetical protein
VRADLDPIDHVLALDLGARGIASFFVPGGALRAAAALRGARRVLIATGFTVAADTPETDGPPGAAVLGRALRRLGARVRYVTDPHNLPIVKAALDALDEPADTVAFPEDEAAAPSILARERPTHLVAIERPGRARSGEYLNLRGVPITAWNRRVDALFLPSRSDASVSPHADPGARRDVRPGRRGRPDAGARRPGDGARRRSRTAAADAASSRPVTVGIGDGGNEIGMGNVRRRLLKAGGLIARTSSIVSVDHLVVAATSNWGAYGVVAGLSRLTGTDLLHAPELEPRIIEACIAAGAFDGVTRRREPTVDGLPAEVHAAVVRLLALAAHPHPRT